MNLPNASGVSVKVIGVGGAGCNAAFRMSNDVPSELEILCVNTDLQSLQGISKLPTFAIGPEITQGLGSGGNPEIGRKAIRESQDQLSSIMAGTDLVFITAGMGGGTGTGAAPVVAEIAKKQGAVTIGVVTLPFSFEGPRLKNIAENGLRKLRSKVDTLITIKNDSLLESLDSTISLEDAFKKADSLLSQGVTGISEIVTSPGLINVDFADVKNLLTHGGLSFMAIGMGKGNQAGEKALAEALSNRLFTTPIDGAQGILLNIRGGRDLELGAVQNIVTKLSEACGTDVNIVLGVIQDPKRKKQVSLTIIATGISDHPNDSRPNSKPNHEDRFIDGDIFHTMEPAATNGYKNTNFIDQKLL